MKPKTKASWFRQVLVVSPLALSLLAPPADAKRREQAGDEQEPRQQVGQASQQVAPSGPTGAPSGFVTGTPAPRQVRPDPARQQQVSGRVVKLEAQTLCLEGDGGKVIPFDVSALRFQQQPEEGQEVRVTYQVEDETDNVAVKIERPVEPAAPPK